ncbi:EF-hand domain-containing protein [Sphingomonas sp. LHG3406-1]|uniref:EF-hand domain-containing protein n=1 Tax=Sphingomonas sp. LHG3406-1 TaxID=2804617 RepID=UPI002626021B|nr:EF-hand domain-containing protein [Sphingomonas sp. LHG3406-1]
MTRLIAGSVAALLLSSGAVLFFTSKAAEPAATAPPIARAAPLVPAALPRTDYRAPPLASPKSREEKRFARADRDDDGRITAAELFEPRRKAFAKLDKDGNGALSFEEWAAKTVDKFASADGDRSGWLTPAEYASTAPPPVKRKAVCSC